MQVVVDLKSIPLKPINPITVNLCAASKNPRAVPTMRSNREMSCCLAARCAARNRRTRSSMVSTCAAFPVGACALRCCGWWLGGDWDDDDDFFAAAAEEEEEEEEEEGDAGLEAGFGEEEDELEGTDVDFVFACGVLDVNRVASATVRGILPPPAIVPYVGLGS